MSEPSELPPGCIKVSPAGVIILMSLLFLIRLLNIFVRIASCFKVSPAAAAAGVISKAGGQHGSSAGGTTQVWKLEEKKET